MYVNTNTLKISTIHFFVFTQLVMLFGCTKISNRVSGFNLYSTSEEIQMGRSYAYQLEQQIKLYKDVIISQYVNELGQKLVNASERNNIPYVFKVVNDPQINAFAIPGGFCYVNIGLIRFAESEAELASVISHEIGHVVGKHGTKKISKSRVINLIGAIILGPNPDTGAQLMTQLASEGLLLNYGRGAELEADGFGIEQMHRAGINPSGAVEFFQKLAQKEKNDPSNLELLMSTHPSTSDRIHNAKQIIRDLPPRQYKSLNQKKFNQIKNRIKIKEE
tara:strand:- start:10101 stop:10931 length:831 start_codon:yes stop_codon:yes gene_type:complete